MIFTIISILSLIGLLSYYIIFSRIKISSFDIENSSFNKPVSIVICAKNELHNLKKHSSFWINQNYNDFEIVIVNDESTDGSYEFLTLLADENKAVSVIHIDKSKEADKSLMKLKGKRYALRKGILAAKNDYLLLTDADCFPKTDNWITAMTKAFSSNEIEIVLGYSPYIKMKGLLNKFIQLETLLTAMHYFGFANIGMPYMGVGRNIAYKKSLFSDEVFIKSNRSLSGDDDLVVQQFSTKINTAYTCHKSSWVMSIPEKNINNYLNQKKRHLGAGVKYPLKLKALLNIFPISLFLYVLSTSFLLSYNLKFALMSMVFHILVILIISTRSVLIKK